MAQTRRMGKLNQRADQLKAPRFSPELCSLPCGTGYKNPNCSSAKSTRIPPFFSLRYLQFKIRLSVFGVRYRIRSIGSSVLPVSECEISYFKIVLLRLGPAEKTAVTPHA